MVAYDGKFLEKTNSEKIVICFFLSFKALQNDVVLKVRLKEKRKIGKDIFGISAISLLGVSRQATIKTRQK